MSDLYLLYESASGYALFQKMQFEEVGTLEETVQESFICPKKFGSIVQLRAFHPFLTAEEALEQQNSVAAGEASEMLMNFLELNLPKVKKVSKANFQVGVIDAELGRSMNEKFPCQTSDLIRELLRGCRMHFNDLVKNLTLVDTDKARLGLAHAYSRNKMQFDPNRQDKPIINAIALLDGLDKNINTFAMRVREWYSWHFPEVGKIVTDNAVYSKVLLCIGLRDSFDQERKAELAEAAGSEEVAEEIIKALNMSMGQDIAAIDWTNIQTWSGEVLKLCEMRETLTSYLDKKLDVVSPNLKTLIGDRVAARLISHAGSLTNLAKFPSSTVQILGAEKALFRALKTKGNTPKYGLIFHSSFIGRAAQKNKGRISRYLANKCSLASRIDCFAEGHTNVFGEKMKDQVEERLRYLTDGVAPRRNVDVMREAIEEAKAQAPVEKKKKKKDKKVKEVEVEEAEVVEEEAAKKKKKDKKRKAEEAVEEDAAPVEEPAKKKKKKNKTAEEA